MVLFVRLAHELLRVRAYVLAGALSACRPRGGVENTYYFRKTWTEIISNS